MGEVEYKNLKKKKIIVLPWSNRWLRMLLPHPIQRIECRTDILLANHFVSSIASSAGSFSSLNRVDIVIWTEKIQFEKNKKSFCPHPIDVNVTYDAKFSPSRLKSFIKQDFLWVNESKEYFPWYAPMPLLPTPPNGSESTIVKQNKKVSSSLIRIVFSCYVNRSNSVIVSRILIGEVITYFNKESRSILVQAYRSLVLFKKKINLEIKIIKKEILKLLFSFKFVHSANFSRLYFAFQLKL